MIDSRNVARGQWMVFRWTMFLTAASLAVYIPYKYLTALHAIEGAYALLFPFSAVLALGGILLAAKPERAFRLPLAVRAPVTLIAAGWIYTGALCVPSLAQSILTHPFGGLFATFHMLAQHVVLSTLVGLLVAAPKTTFTWMGLPAPEAPMEPALAASDV